MSRWPLLLLLACHASTGPVSSAWLLRTWCPVDSLTVYAYQIDTVIDHYVPGHQTAAYRLTFHADGTVTPAGAYVGRFTAGDGWFHLPGDTVDVTTSPPGVTGQWLLGPDRLVLAWPVLAGPNWFWVLAQHPTLEPTWRTVLDWRTGTGSIQLRFTWTPCPA